MTSEDLRRTTVLFVVETEHIVGKVHLASVHYDRDIDRFYAEVGMSVDRGGAAAVAPLRISSPAGGADGPLPGRIWSP